MLFGTAMHKALETFFAALKEDPEAPISILIEAFDDKAHRLPFNRTELDETIERGHEFLTGWHDHGRAGWNADTKVEYNITTEFPLADMDITSLRLRGNIDKMEIEKDGVTVIDYKTGQPKTRNAIQGLTKSDDGGYCRQIIFYKLLIDLEGKYTFKAGTLDFLQPDSRGKFHKETFEVTDADVTELTTTMQRVAKEIYNVDFWDKKCDDKACEYCALRELMG
jgi:hypothetical protein